MAAVEGVDGSEGGENHVDELGLDADLDELDDKEFDIPPVENPPTLESILNAPDEDGSLQESSIIIQDDQGETGSLSSQEGILSEKPKKKNKKSIRYEQHGAILRHVVLKSVAAQMASAADRVNAGLPTALAVSSLIAVGTSHGLVLVFDPKQVLKWCLGSTAVGTQFGAVSTISLNIDCTRLLCGFAKGQITMWDLTNGKLLRTVTDAHPPGSAVLHLKFTDDRTIAVMSDSGGSVYELSFKRLIGVRTCESQCLFSGSRGEVCVVEPLCVQRNLQEHPMKDVIVVAMASLSKVLIVVIKPQLKVHYVHPLRGDPATLPLLSWQFVVIQVSDNNRVIDPVLAFARDQTIYFVQVICRTVDDIKISPLQKTELPYKLLAITWINSRTMIIIDTSERAHVIDVRSEEELEVIDLAVVQLVYSTSFYKSLATGGNVSKALAYAGERACYQSLVTFNGQLVLLGTKGIHVLMLRTWLERIDALLKREKYQEALSLAQSFYDGKAKGVVGLYGIPEKRKEVVGEQIMTILHLYVDLAMTHLCPSRGKVEELESYFQGVVTTCVEHCLWMRQTDFLFGKLYDRFSEDPIAKGTYLECLEPYILNDMLTSITPSVMKDFVQHYEQKGILSSVESCIIHMNIASLDIHQVVSLCWAHGLYDAILYIFNQGIRDYTTPLEELFTRLSAALSTGKQLTYEQVQLGNKILVYISCCLVGRAYPLGDIPSEWVATVRDEILRCMTALHTPKHPEDEPVYPRLRSLVHFDTREFFNVLSLAFEDSGFELEQKQRIVDILLQLMVEGSGFSPPQVGVLFTFLARQMAKHNNAIMVNRTLFEQVLESLCASGEESRHEERQQALLELLNAGGLQHFDEDRLIAMADGAKFYRVCETMHDRRGHYHKILSCYWRDAARQQQVFVYISRVLTEGSTLAEQKQMVREEVLKNLEHLVKIDAKKTAKLVLITLNCSPSEAVKQVVGNEDVMFDFLQGLFAYRDSNVKEDISKRPVKVEPEICERYLELMCCKAPEQVLNFLRSEDSYRLQKSLEICQRYQLTDGMAYLLERSGDIQGAFDILMGELLKKLGTAVGKTSDVFVESQTAIGCLIQLLQRNCYKMDQHQREKLWFPLLEVVLAEQRKATGDGQDWKTMTRQIINAMMAYIPLPAVLQKIMSDPAYSSGRFGEMKDLLLGMLDTYNYEKTLLHTCANLINHDLHHQLAALTVAVGRAVTLRSDFCLLCSRAIATVKEKDSAVCFQCGHGFHGPCIASVTAAGLTSEEGHKWVCYICNKSRAQTQGVSRSLHSSGGGSSAVQQMSPPSRQGEAPISEAQLMALESLRQSQRCPSRLAILSELAQRDRVGGGKLSYQPYSRSSILQNEQFPLRVAAPPPP